MATVTDQMGNLLVFEKAPERIVSLVPSQTELLIKLRLRENVLGITKFCIHPEDLRSTTRIVGGTKNVRYDTIAELQPDIILCNKEENTKEMVEKLRGIAPVHISDIKTVEDNLELIGQYGILFNRIREAGVLSKKIAQRYHTFKDASTISKRIKAGYFIWRAPYMVASNDTFIHTMLSLNGFENVFAEVEGRYPEIYLKDLPEMDIVLLSSEPYPFSQKHMQELKHYTSAQIILVDGAYFSWYGSRLLEAFDYFEELRKDTKF